LTATVYPKRLIEVDLPIKRISAHARREKSIRHGHISTLHIWWARRPLAACRAVICASLWPDPADANCPQEFRDAAQTQLVAFAKATQSNRWGAEICDDGSFSRYMRLAHGLNIDSTSVKGQTDLRAYLLDFIADFAAWESSTNGAFLDTARALTQAAHEALGGEKGTRPLVVDPFAGGGAIPLEALRVGADAFASDLNPVAVLLNKVVLEYIPKYGQKLADEVCKWGQWVKVQTEKELAQFYPKDSDGSTPIAYLWARTIKCEGPGCGAEVPLMRSLWLARKSSRSIAVKIIPRPTLKRVDFELVNDAKPTDVGAETVKRGSATCPCCGYTTPVGSVRLQLKARHGGANDARLYAVVNTRPSEQGRFYRLPTKADEAVLQEATFALGRLERQHSGALSWLPDEAVSTNELRRISVPLYGMTRWRDMFTPRQLLALGTISRLINDVATAVHVESGDGELNAAVVACLALCFGRVADLANALCGWKLDVQCPTHLFARQAIGMVWDFSESVPTSASSGSWAVMVDRFEHIMREVGADWREGQVVQSDAAHHALPNDSAQAVITDPPYYDAVPYAHLADFFYVWLRRLLFDTHATLFTGSQTPKDAEIVVDRPHELSTSTKRVAQYEAMLGAAFNETRRVTQPSGISVVVFASKTTSSWEAILRAIVEAGWVITGSWPIDTEMDTRVAAQGQARLASSIHLVCRPREDADGNIRQDEIGDWRDVLAELPVRIREWMVRLSSEGVVGADAIFACLGPALEIFSRYSRVEKASGEVVLLKEYLTYVWGAVAQEALAQIFQGVDATGFEEDARLTAMWLWTLNGGGVSQTYGAEPFADIEDASSVDDSQLDGGEEGGGKLRGGGYVLEFDAARKIAQGLGAHLEQLSSVIEVKGDKARLLGVAERTKRLFGKDEATAPQQDQRKRREKQMKLFSPEELGELEVEGGGWGDKSVPKLGDTILDRVHQSMILFAAGRGEAVRRFLVEDGVGRDQRFWRLANALSALYPQGTDEKRWVDGVLARKKGLGL
jgi:putative DNA methylase